MNPLLEGKKPEIFGRCDPAFRAVADAFEQAFFERGDQGEVGATCAVMIDGELVVDLWGGFADVGRDRGWSEDTLVCCWSVNKALCATLGLMLVEQGVLDLDTPVAHYWPEFAGKGKEGVLVRHFLEHRSGVSYVDADLAPGATYEWETMVQAIEETSPNWPAGEKHGYQNLTMGYLTGELFARVNGGRRLARFVREDLAGPLGLDWHFAVPDEVMPRLATVYRIPDESVAAMVAADPDSVFARSMRGSDPEEDYNSRAWHKAQMGAGSGHCNARAMARLFSCLSRGGELDGARILSEDTLELATRQAALGLDAVIGMDMRYSTGFEMSCPPAMPIGPSDSAFGYIGAGGALGFADPTVRLGFGYAHNFMHMGVGPGPCGLPMTEAAIAAASKL